jgi:hypothetical protein
MRRLKKSFLYILILVPGSSFSQTIKHSCITSLHPGWVFTALSPDKNMTVYINAAADTARVDGGIKVWVLSDFRTLVINKIAYKNVESEALEIINCEKNQEKLVQRITYDSSGKILETLASDLKHEWINTLPKSIRETVILKTKELYN